MSGAELDSFMQAWCRLNGVKPTAGTKTNSFKSLRKKKPKQKPRK